uniref:Uncharacterized protein n=1 Tax=Physcomitrium patens TaxID=3218 RepID=A0A2K1J226_PHYPA|nr:hypothetical protein PHYPA_023472 [Physcomitrium patens]
MAIPTWPWPCIIAPPLARDHVIPIYVEPASDLIPLLLLTVVSCCRRLSDLAAMAALSLMLCVAPGSKPPLLLVASNRAGCDPVSPRTAQDLDYFRPLLTLSSLSNVLIRQLQVLGFRGLLLCAAVREAIYPRTLGG